MHMRVHVWMCVEGCMHMTDFMCESACVDMHVSMLVCTRGRGRV